MKKVTYMPAKPLKYQKPIVEHTNASISDIRLRARALNWIILTIEKEGE